MSGEGVGGKTSSHRECANMNAYQRGSATEKADN